MARLRENGSAPASFPTLDKIITSDRSRSEVIILDNASLAKGAKLSRLIGIAKLAISVQGPFKRIILILLDDREFREVWQKEQWGPKAQARLKKQQIFDFPVNAALNVARDIKVDAAIPVTDEVLVRAVDDLAQDGASVSPLALSILMSLIAKSSVGGREFGLEDYRTSGGANGMMASFIVNDASSWAQKSWRQILARIAKIAEGDGIFSRDMFSDMAGAHSSEVSAILDRFSSENVRVLRFDSDSGIYTIIDAWKPAIVAMKDRFTRAVERTENSIKDKFIRWRDQWTVEERNGNAFNIWRKSRKSLLSWKELRSVKDLEGSLSLKEGMADYVVRSRRYRLVQLITGLVLLISLPPMIYSEYERRSIKSDKRLKDAVAAALKDSWGVPGDFEEYTQKVLSVSLVSGCTVNQLTWLPRGLRRLDAECENVESLIGLPQGLTELNISSTKVRDLRLIPPGITVLNIASTSLGSDINLGQYKNLKTLNMTGLNFPNLKLLPAVSSLSLGNANLDDIEGLPEKLDSLDLSGSSVVSLKKLPKMLRRLRLKQNALGPIDYLPQHLNELETDRILKPDVSFPDSLRVLTTSVPLIVPQGLEALTLRGHPFGFTVPSGLKKLWVEWLTESVSLSDLPKGLEALKFIWPKDGRFVDLPPKLRVLDVSWSPTLNSLAGITAPVADLNISHTAVRDFRSLPDSITRLTDQICELNEVKEVPPHLQALDLSGCWKLELIENLPESLQELNVAGTAISSLPELPDSLLRLNISNTKIAGKLPKMPAKLQELTINFHQLRSLEGLPPTVNRIVFVGYEKDGKLVVSEPARVE